MNRIPSDTDTLNIDEIARMWWPLALSWLLMSVEGPAHSAVVARLADPEINLAAWGGIVFPVALVIESPVVMLLSASTALSKDWAAYLKLRRIAMVMGAILTVVHILIAFTPLYDVVARDIIGAPASIIEPGRMGLMIMTPWTWAIAYRRFQQGAMIRFGHARAVGTGTVVRLIANGSVLLAGYLIKRVPGIVVASSAVATGVAVEALYAGLRVRPIIRSQIRTAPRTETTLTLQTFTTFYAPLALTSLISFFVSPLGSAAMSRMPLALQSLAAWPVVNGLIFVLRSPGLAYNEVVVALLDKPGSLASLRRFAALLALASSLIILAMAATPLAELWLGDVMALPPALVTLSRPALWLALLLPCLALLQSWYQGIIVNSQRTRAITESMVLYMVAIVMVMGAGILTQQTAGLYVAIASFEVAGVVQVAWLWYRSRPPIRTLTTRDQAGRLESAPAASK